MKTIIFDFDGVIIDSFNVVFNILYEKINRHTKYEVKVDDLKEEYMNSSLKEIVKKYKINKFLLPIIYWKIGQSYTNHLTEMKPFPKVNDTLKSLKQKGYKLGILSSNKKRNIVLFLKNNNLDKYIDFIDTFYNPLKKDKYLENIIKRKGLNRFETYYVGDEVRDYCACMNAKINCVIATYGFKSENLLNKLNTTKIDSIEKLEYIIKKF